MSRNDFAKNYCVTRQHYYYSGERAIDISTDRDAVPPDCMSSIREFSDPNEAVQAAIAERADWARQLIDQGEVDDIDGVGFTYGNAGIIGLEPETGATEDQLRAWGQRQYDSLRKCDRCAEIVTEPYALCPPYDNDEVYCSNNCADLALEFMLREEEEFQAELDKQFQRREKAAERRAKYARNRRNVMQNA